MLRIIDGLGRSCNDPRFDANSAVVYGSTNADTFTVSAVELGHGHLEVSAKRDLTWRELDWTSDQIRDHVLMLEELKFDVAHQADQRDKCLKIASNRAKTRIRRLCKSMGTNTLLTLTYRHNELDLSRAKADMKEFNRRMLRVFPLFACVVGFEMQTRGAYHMHLGTAAIPAHFIRPNAQGVGHRVKSFDVIRAVWRSVTKERGGTVNIAKRKRHLSSSPARIASYLSKYLAKSFADGEKGSNRFTSYGAGQVPAVVNLGRVGSALEAVEIAFGLLGGRSVFGQHFSKWGDWFYLHGENLHPIVGAL